MPPSCLTLPRPTLSHCRIEEVESKDRGGGGVSEPPLHQGSTWTSNGQDRHGGGGGSNTGGSLVRGGGKGHGGQKGAPSIDG